MCEELGLENKVIPVLSSAPATKNRYLYVHNRLTKLTGSLFHAAGPFQKALLPAVVSAITKVRARSVQCHRIGTCCKR